MQSKGLTVLHTGPYSFETSPVELFWAQFKSTNLNPESKPAGLK